MTVSEMMARLSDMPKDAIVLIQGWGEESHEMRAGAVRQGILVHQNRASKTAIIYPKEEDAHVEGNCGCHTS